jgi:hypothetical protein
MSQCGVSSCLPPQTGGKRSIRKTKKRVRFTKYVQVCNIKSCKRRTHRKKHKKLPKNCKNTAKK